jgi:DNA-binding transcriptional regulator YiaG
MPREHIGKRFRKLREEAGLTQVEFAHRLGVHWRNVQVWENDQVAVDVFKARALLDEARKIASQGKGEKVRKRKGRKK